MTKEIGITILVPTARAVIPKRGRLADLVAPCLARLPVRKILVAGRPDALFLMGSDELGVPVEIVPSEQVERNHLRNLALARVTSTHVMLLDDDTILMPHGSLLARLHRLNPGDLLTFAARLHLPLGEDISRCLAVAAGVRWSKRIRYCPLLRRDSWQSRAWYTAEVTFPTNFCIAHSQALKRIGGFNEQFNGWGYEDVEFANRCLTRGKICFCRDDATAIHIEHHVAPDQGVEAARNYRRLVARCRTDPSFPPWSATFYGVAAQFLTHVPRYRPQTIRRLMRALLKVQHFARCDMDVMMASSFILDNISGLDLIALGVYGGAADRADCRDVDLCAIVGYGDSRFFLETMPSGKPLELHTVSLPAVRQQINGIPYVGGDAFLQWFKFRRMRFLIDYHGVASHFLRHCFRSDTHVLPYLITLYVGLAALFFKKPRTADQLAIGRYLTAVGMLSGCGAPSRDTVLDEETARAWFEEQLRALRSRYSRLREAAEPTRFLRWPPNVLGDAILRDGSHST